MTSSRYLLVHEPDTLETAHKLVAEAVRPVTAAAFAPGPPPVSVGVWDLGAWLGGLARLIEAINRAQTAFVLFEVKATVPAGFISRPQRVIPWLTEALGRKLKTPERRDIENNLIANDYFELADVVRRDLKLDYIVGITPSMVAGDEEDEVYWNHFSTFNGRTILVSTHELREFSRKTGWPLEGFLATILVPQILVARFFPNLGFHDDRGCLFDYNEDRISLAKKAQEVRIEPECLNAIDAPYRPAAEALVRFLQSVGRD